MTMAAFSVLTYIISIQLKQQHVQRLQQSERKNMWHRAGIQALPDFLTFFCRFTHGIFQMGSNNDPTLCF